ncbi:MAG: M23 family metallopeptidase [Clostridiales bacterium]|nr:M23 family metallopeptidase [Clostridiales bacterium]
MCLVLLAATAVWVTRNNLEYFSQNGLPGAENQIQEEYPFEAAQPQENSPAVLIDDAKDMSASQTEQQQAVSDERDKSAQQTTVHEQPTAPASSQVQNTTSSKERMLVPLLGKICMDYGKDNLVYSKTLEQWTTHHGIDIAAPIGTQVKAVRSGTVTEITNHPTLGIMITIDHGDGLVTRYANLQNGNMVKEGQKVGQGKVISGVGNTAEFEIGDVPHLHFEVLKDGEHQDPKLYLPNM